MLGGAISPLGVAGNICDQRAIGDGKEVGERIAPSTARSDQGKGPGLVVGSAPRMSVDHVSSVGILEDLAIARLVG